METVTNYNLILYKYRIKSAFVTLFHSIQLLYNNTNTSNGYTMLFIVCLATQGPQRKPVVSWYLVLLIFFPKILMQNIVL